MQPELLRRAAHNASDEPLQDEEDLGHVDLPNVVSCERSPLAGSQPAGEIVADSERVGNAEPMEVPLICDICDIEHSRFEEKRLRVHIPDHGMGVEEKMVHVKIFFMDGETLVDEYAVSVKLFLTGDKHAEIVSEVVCLGENVALWSRNGMLIGRYEAPNYDQQTVQAAEVVLTCDIKPSDTCDGQDIVQCFSMDGEKVCELPAAEFTTDDKSDQTSSSDSDCDDDGRRIAHQKTFLEWEGLGPRVAAAVRAQAGPEKKITLVAGDGSILWKDTTYESRCKLNATVAKIHAHPQMVRHRFEERFRHAAATISEAPLEAEESWKEFRDSSFYKDAYRLVELCGCDEDYEEFFKSEKITGRSLSIRERCCPCGGQTFSVKDTFQELRENLPPGVTTEVLLAAEAAAAASCNTSFRRSILLNSWSNEYPLIALEARRIAAERGTSAVNASTFLPPRPRNEACDARWKQFLDGQALTFVNERTQKYANRFKTLLQELEIDGKVESKDARPIEESINVPETDSMGVASALRPMIETGSMGVEDSKEEAPALVKENYKKKKKRKKKKRPSLGRRERETLKGMMVPSKNALEKLFETARRRERRDEVAETKKVIEQSSSLSYQEVLKNHDEYDKQMRRNGERRAMRERWTAVEPRLQPQPRLKEKKRAA
eukprot:TRINITY_DN36376_c0_g1_i1.p1 TRINITY_DN36376_c0_g1~~TRINITY_DN36376_c0_g1_i1.p1  ORF type:complete len:662 (+),score=108.90 TRINITY_DN36376_c0_g1_i1:59-2044(+)